MAQFALAGLIVLALFLGGSVLVFRSLGRSEALRDARQFAVLTGQGIVEPALQNSVLSGDQRALAQLDRIVQERVLGDRIVRVKVWTVGGHIVYSDEPRLIGQTFPLGNEKLDVLRTGDARAEVSSLEGAENRYERGLGDVYEVYLPIRAPDGTPLVFRVPAGSTVASTGRRSGSRSRRSSSSASSCSGSCRCRSRGGSRVVCAAARRIARSYSSERSKPPMTNAEGSQLICTTASSRTSRASRTPSAQRPSRQTSVRRRRPAPPFARRRPLPAG